MMSATPNEKKRRGPLSTLYRALVKGEGFLGHFLLLIIRLYWGWLLIGTGLGKWAHGEQVGQFFGSLGIPAPEFMAYLVGTFELLGGLSLFLGLFTRLFTISLAVIFFTAYATAHKEALQHFFSDPALFIEQEPFLYLYATLVVLCFGAGFISFDYWIEKRLFQKRS